VTTALFAGIRHDRVGYNYRMDGFQGAVLRIKLKQLDGWTAKRQELAGQYRKHLANAVVGLPCDDSRERVCFITSLPCTG